MMKKQILLIATLSLSVISKAQYTNIPDSNFEEALISLGLDVGTVDGQVLTNSIDTVTILNIPYSNIQDLSGIEDFNSLTNLNCYGNPIEELDLSNNNQLKILDFGATSVLLIDLSNNLLLEDIDFGKSPTTCIDLSAQSQLTKLRCGHNLKYLNIKNGNNINMTSFSAISNPNLTCINVDSVNWATTNWDSDVDNVNLFSENCQQTCEDFLSISDNYSNLKNSIYPNPASDFIQVNSELNNGLFTAKMYDLRGRNISTWRVEKNQKISLNNISSGIYLLEIKTTNGESEIHKVVKK
jgi:hypothetical protein